MQDSKQPAGQERLLGVVLISRNQIWNVDRLIRSVLRESADLGGAEVVLVDSASTDGTPEAAARHGILVLRIREGEHVSPSAGRYIGFRAIGGKYVLFLDGDAELYPGWLPQALGLLEREEGVAVVSGPRVTLPPDAGEDDKPPLESTPGPDDWHPRPHTGGSALYRRAVLEEVGSFQPFLFSDEEPELAVRIKDAGHRIAQLEYPIIFDYGEPTDEIGTMARRRGRRLYLGAGQNLRLHFGKPTFGRYVRERGFGLLPLLGGLVGLGTVIVTVVTGDARWFGGWSAVVVAAVLADAIRKRSLYRALHAVVQRMLIAEGTMRGLLLGIRPASEYRPAVDVIGSRGDIPTDSLD